MTYESLLVQADSHQLTVKEKHFKQFDGLIVGNKIGIRKDIETTKKKSCVLAEEIGHHFTSAGDILDQSDAMNQKQEHRARLYGYNLKIGLMGIVRAYENGCRNLYEMAEFLDCTEEYLAEALNCYKSKYGKFVTADNYIIYFIPSLIVIKITG